MSFLPTWLAQGGWVLWLLACVSVFSVANMLLVASKIAAAGLKVSAGDMDRLVAYTAHNEVQKNVAQKGPYGVVAANAKILLNESVEKERAQTELSTLALNELNSLRNGLRSLEVIAATAPLLGLLGTVLGMIEAFQQLEQAGNQIDPSLLSGGIWQALLTTAAGLIVALPALLAWHIFDRRFENARVSMNVLLSRIISLF